MMVHTNNFVDFTCVDRLVSLARFARAFLSTSFSSSRFGGSYILEHEQDPIHDQIKYKIIVIKCEKKCHFQK